MQIKLSVNIRIKVHKNKRGNKTAIKIEMK